MGTGAPVRRRHTASRLKQTFRKHWRLEDGGSSRGGGDDVAVLWRGCRGERWISPARA